MPPYPRRCRKVLPLRWLFSTIPCDFPSNLINLLSLKQKQKTEGAEAGNVETKTARPIPQKKPVGQTDAKTKSKLSNDILAGVSCSLYGNPSWKFLVFTSVLTHIMVLQVFGGSSWPPFISQRGWCMLNWYCTRSWVHSASNFVCRLSHVIIIIIC